MIVFIIYYDSIVWIIPTKLLMQVIPDPNVGSFEDFIFSRKVISLIYPLFV